MNHTSLSWQQHFLRFFGRSGLPGSRSLVSRWGGLTPRPGQDFCVDFDTLRYTGDLGEYVDRHIWCFGAYAQSELDFLSAAAAILRTEREVLTYLDIGANVGQHALFMARRAHRVLAFEPNPRVADRLQRNRDANGLTNIEIHHVALGLEDGDAALGSGLPANSGSRSLVWSLDPTQDIRVPVRHAGRFLDAKNLALTRADIVKLDVEGFEKNVLTAMKQLLLRDRPIILFELVGQEVKGGFHCEDELRSVLYPDHRLFSLNGSGRARIEPFKWSGSEEAVCLPEELVADFRRLLA